MTDELDDQIRENAAQPRRASADGVEAEQRSVSIPPGSPEGVMLCR
jgi:hypothetical protein